MRHLLHIMDNTTSRYIVKCNVCSSGRWSTDSYCNFCIDQEEKKAELEAKGFIPKEFFKTHIEKKTQLYIPKQLTEQYLTEFEKKIKDYRFSRFAESPWRVEFHEKWYSRYGAKVIEYIYIYDMYGVEGLRQHGFSYYDIAAFVEEL